MPRGQAFDWTREDLERVRDTEGDGSAVLLAEELGVARASVYSVRKRIKDEGIDEILRKQAHRYESYHQNGGRTRPETLAEQVGRLYSIRISGAGRGGGTAQYTVTIPSRLGEAWVAKWGRQVRFKATDEGLLIMPVALLIDEDLPAWVTEPSVEAEA